MVETLTTPETTPKVSASAGTVSDTKKEVANVLSTPDPRVMEKTMAKDFDASEWLMDEQLGGFSLKEYNKIHKEKGAKAASEYAAASIKKPRENKKTETEKQQETPTTKVANVLSTPDPKSVEMAMAKDFDASEWLMDEQLGGFTQKEYDKIHKEKGAKAASEYAAASIKKYTDEKKIQEKQQETPTPQKEETKPTTPEKKPDNKPEIKKEEKKSWRIWKSIKSIPKQTKNLISYPIRTSLSTLKYLTIDRYDHGLSKKKLKSQWENFKNKFVWDYKK